MRVNKKLLFLSILIGVGILPVNADNLSEVNYPKAPAYRVGISELPETQFIEALQKPVKIEKKYANLDNTQENNFADRTYADLSIKNLSKEVAQDLEFEEQDMLSDLSLLWQGAAMQSDTINFALYKLANPDADKPDEKSIKNVLKTIASMSTLVGASMGSPVLAGSSLIGGNILGIMTQDTKALNYKYTRVTDADMIILIRKVEDLQQNAVNLYYDYMSAKKQLDFATKLVEDRQEKFNLAQKNNAARELVVITDAYYRTALDKQRSAKAEFFAKRAALEQFVGNETFMQFEQELRARENGEKNSTKAEEQTSEKTAEQLIEQVKEQVPEQIEEPRIQLPDIRAREYVSDLEDETGIMTGLSSNIENIDEDMENAQPKKKTKVKNQKKAKAEKRVKEKKIKEKKIKEKKVKEKKDPLKGLIFLHGQDKNSVVSPRQVTDNTSEIPASTSQGQYQAGLLPQVQTHTPPNPYGFAPLDEIRVPDLTRGGYSIHSDLSY